MELYQLRGFAAVAELGHLTRAAEKLHVSQPALSAQIRALEETLGVTLFERGSSGMSLTAAGRHLLPVAQEVVAKASLLRGLAQSFHGDIAGRVRVGTPMRPANERSYRGQGRASSCHSARRRSATPSSKTDRSGIGGSGLS